MKTFQEFLNERRFKPSKLEIGMEVGGGTYLGEFNGYDYILSPIDEEKELNWEDAVDYCEDLNVLGYNDWFLPNKEELNFAYEQFTAHGDKLDFTYGITWASSEDSNSFSWCQSFSNGNQGYVFKNSLNYVRAFRKL